MCGIAGIACADPARAPDRDTIARMTDIVRHRGPDGAGLHVAAGIGLGVRRLAIVDVEGGAQPIASEDGSIVLVCNGEIYNHVELRRELAARGHRFRTGSDVEVIVHLYEEAGPGCLARLRGMFGFALWDAPRRRLMLARDRLGIKPLYYAAVAGAIHFGSEQKSILAAGAVDRALDGAALGELFTLGFVRGPRTLFSSIRSLPPAHYLLYQQGAAAERRYWHVRFPPRGEPPERRSAGEWAEALREKLTESVRLHLRSDVPVGAWLSGGLDSSAIVALMARLLDRPIRTFSLTFDPPDFDEFHQQRTLDTYPEYRLSGERTFCGADSLEHLPASVWHMENPSLGGIAVVRMMLSGASARGVKVVLTGEGADEILGGYDWFRSLKLLGPFARLPAPLRRLARLRPIRRRWPRASRLLAAERPMAIDRYSLILSPRTGADTVRLWSADLGAHLASLDGGDRPVWHPDDFDAWHPFAQLQHYELSVRLPDLVLTHVDRASMAHGLEVRVPFLDHELVELCARVPPRLKLRFLREKYVLRQAMSGALPPEIAWRRKRGLRAPAGHWLRAAPLPPFAAHLLEERVVREKGYFDPAYVRTLLDRHRAGLVRGASELMGVLTVHLWDEMFRRGRPAPLSPHTAA